MSQIADLHRKLLAIQRSRRQVEKTIDRVIVILEESREAERQILQQIERLLLENAIDFPSVIGEQETNAANTF